MSDKKLILIIDDDKYLQKAYSAKLTHEGFDVLGAGTGAEGMRRIRESSPDLVLLDLVMPEMSGIEVLKTVSEDPELKEKTKIIVLSNSVRESDKELMLKYGAADYFIKSTTPIATIVEVIRKQLG
ncbi:MAG TPA: response regulator [Candidatus Baltobacteraceae bacterium]|jgi:DNA-binding response OmpR family regulator|nr:response regulator [Candidatus Baltobacteraceae bacterium]